MGSKISKEEQMLRHPIKGQADEFYFACREGDINYVKRALPNMSWEQLNQMQLNGSTYLHVACYTGRTDIVRLLLQRGCLRSKLNLYGYTPYDEACSEEVKVLFHRPRDEHNPCRFVDEGVNETFQLTTPPRVSHDSTRSTSTMIDDDDQTNEIDGDYDFISNEWIETFNRFDKYSAQMNGKIVKSSLYYRLCGLKRSALHSMMDYVIKVSLTENDSSNPSIERVVKDYEAKRKLTSLLTLYTHQSSFYTALRDENKCKVFTLLLYRNLSQLRGRFYKGLAYRGMKLTNKELSAYWALSKRSGFALMNTKFQSSSKDEKVAETFLNPPDIPKSPDAREHMVIIEYNFPDPCESAIDLAPTKEKNLSEYTHEAEVMILPHTLFEICNMKYDATTKTARIRLKHILPCGILAGFRSAMKEFRTMSPEDLQQTCKRLENNMKTMQELLKNLDN